MSLLLNEDFTLYSLRLGYLRNIDDGVGERLITLDPSILHDPAFRAAGFVVDHAAIKRCYSPPIPTTGVAEYFTRPVRTRQGRTLHDDSMGEEEEEEGGGLLTGRTSDDTLGPAALTDKDRQRRKQRAQLREEDSSDLSDDSEEEESTVQSIKFSRMPSQNTMGAARKAVKMAPEVKIISPSYRTRTSSLSASEPFRSAIRPTRPRADTVTSSEFSSESEMLETNPVFRRKLPTRPGRSTMLAHKIAEEDDEDSVLEDEDDDVDEDAEVAEASDLSDDFEGDDIAAQSPDLLANVASGDTNRSGSAGASNARVPQRVSTVPDHVLVELPGLPDGHYPTYPASSLLTQALKGDTAESTSTNSLQKYAELYGKSEPNPIWIKIYYPSGRASSMVLQVPIKRQANTADGAGPPRVTDLIGLALFRYQEEGCQPTLPTGDMNIERWELRMVDDGEIEMDFPALMSDRAITDFTSNNNRPPARRARDKPWDEFGLVRLKGAVPPASEPMEQEDAPVAPQPRQSTAVSSAQADPPLLTPSMVPSRNPITGPVFTLSKTSRKDSPNLLDAPAVPTATFTPRSGPETELVIHFTDPQSFQSTQLNISLPADTYIAEVFDTACTRLRLDKALYVLKVRGTLTVAPSDRTIEALGTNRHLDLSRRRFGAVGDFGLGTSGSPGSTSPNAPLELVPNTPPIGKDGKRRKAQGATSAYTGNKKYDLVTTSTLPAFDAQAGRRYNVLRKQPLSFSASHPRTLIITPEFLQILPAQDAQDGPVSGKVTNIHMSSIIGVKVSRKHPKVVRVVVFREKEAKRYDFECSSREEAQAIVADVRVGVGEYGGGEDSFEK